MAAPPLSRPFISIWLILLLSISVIIRVEGARDYYYNPDEAMHIGMADGVTLGDVWNYSLYETHPPLGNYVRHYWLMVSHDPDYVRSMSLICGIALILLYYRIGRFAGGEMTGICCAALVAFSRGCIIQSYITRNYILFLLLLSLCFYAYLLWREKRGMLALLCYGAFGSLAVATHFSAIFFIACLGTFESAWLYKTGAARRSRVQYLIANLVIAAVWMVIFHLWQPTLEPLKTYFSPSSFYSAPVMVLLTLLYPFAVSTYLFPSPAAALAMAMIFILLVFFPSPAPFRDKKLRPLLLLMCCAFALGMAFFISGKYTLVGTRHSMWVFPFMIPVIGWVFADRCVRLSRCLPLNTHLPWQAIIACVILVSGYGMYSPDDRFSDESEYAIPMTQWNALNAFFNTLGPSDLVVVERDAILFKDIYPSLGTDPFTGNVKATLLPYKKTHLLFNPYFRLMQSTELTLQMLKEAKERHMLDGIDRIIFFHSRWRESAVADMILCTSLDKKIMAFPELPYDYPFTREGIKHIPALVLILSRQTLYDELLSPSGKAHSCL